MFTPLKYKGKILVIDDEALVSSILKAFLELKGHTVFYAASGEEALDIAAGESLDIIITDVRLPGISGMDVLKKVLADQPECDVIVITGYSSFSDAVEFMKSGALDYIIKPINQEHLEIVISKALERKNLIMAAKERDYYREISLIDPLTGVFNRRYLMQAIDKEIQKATRGNRECSFFIVDIDDFKMINDEYGHQSGDMVLKGIAESIGNTCRRYDTLARYGGEEFCILLPDTSAEDSAFIAGRMLAVIGNNCFQGLDRRITASIGISVFPLHAADREDIIKKADSALYCSKRKGKNQYTIYSHDMEYAVK